MVSVGVSISCEACGITLTVMKRCTRCPDSPAFYVSFAIFKGLALPRTVSNFLSTQCSKDCQRNDWPRHRYECGLPCKPDESIISGISSAPPQKKSKKISELCEECAGTGLVIAKSPPSNPLPRLEGVMPGCVIRQVNCSKCEGMGMIFSDLIPAPKETSSTRKFCPSCQAYGGDPCTCNLGNA